MNVLYKRGCDVEVGDTLRSGKAGFLILGFTPYDPPTGGAGRIALNAWGDGMVVFDATHVAVVDYRTPTERTPGMTNTHRA